MYSNRLRKQRAAGVIGLMLSLFFVLLVLGIFTFDLSRMQMIQRELYSLSESAGLTGTSMLASYDVSDDDAAHDKLANAQNNSIAYAANMVQLGTITGSRLDATSAPVSLSYATFLTPGLAKCNIFIQLMDAFGNPLTVPNPAGRALKVSLCYGYRPLFWPILTNGGVMPLLVSSISGLPQVDTVMVFDFSGSMDDLTTVTIVNRVWDNGNHRMQYNIVPPYSGSTSVTGQSNFCLANYIGWNYGAAPEGTPANVQPPQDLDSLGGATYTGTSNNFQSNCNYALVYDFIVRRYSINPTFATDYGTPPGNCNENNPTTGQPIYPAIPGVVPDQGPGTHFTDLVVNIANPGSPPFVQPLYGPDTFTGCSINFSGWGTYTVTDATGATTTLNYETDNWLRTAGSTYNFNNLGVLVEAARGNMENSVLLYGSTAPVAWFGGTPVPGAFAQFGANTNTPNDGSGIHPPYVFPSPATGYQAAYQQLAMLYSQPLATALDGAYTGFYQKINGLADCRYGFVGFSDNTAFGGSAAVINSTHMVSAFDSAYNLPGGGLGNLYARGYAKYPPDYGPFCELGTPENGPGKPVWMARSELSANTTQMNSFLTASNASWDINGAGGGYPGAPGNGLYNSLAAGGTDCGEALLTAVTEFNQPGVYQYNAATVSGPSTSDRRAARRAVIFFTDGIPTDQADGVGPTGQSLLAAQTASNEGIAFYTIGLALNPALQTDQQTYLNGLCAAASNASAAFYASSTAAIKSDFSAIARRLTENQRTQ